MKKLIYLSIAFIELLICPASFVNAQGVGVNPSGAPAHPSAIFDASATNQGMLIPRLTTVQRDAIVNPAQSLLIFNTTTNCFEAWGSVLWQTVWCAACPSPSAVSASASPNPLCEGSMLSLTGSATLASSWSWTGPNGFTSTFQNPTIPGITTADAGVYSLTASNICGSAAEVNTASVTVNTVPTGVTATATPNPVCEGATLTLTGSATGATAWSWTGPNGFTSTLQSPTISGITAASAGAYTLTASNACGAAIEVNTAPVTLNTIPTGVTASASPNPICAGASLTLTGSATGATAWSWTGPNGFTSTLQSPAISNITTAGAGVYSLTASNVCGSAAAVNTASVTVNTVPTGVSASASPNPVCSGATLTLTGSATGATDWSWTGPNSFTSTLQSPTISGVTAASAGVYALTASNTCGSAAPANTASVMVSTVPTGVTASASPNPICAGSALSLTGSATGATAWSWTGPNGFTSTLQSPTISGITAAGAGVYSLTASNVCGSAAAVNTASVTVNPPPTTANAGADINPACGTSTATLSGNTPSVGTGNWSVVSGTATITTPSSPTSGVTGLAVPGTATLRWTISNSPCASSTDNVIITTSTCFNCGTTLTINHVAGAVAPETKTVNYGTVLTNLSGTNKCWITRNLGATNQAASGNDNTDAAAGWYWQFNRKQGYKVNPLAPSWTVTYISENSDWLPANDPCTIELGAGWRLPTYTEWNNADANGGWNSYFDTYSSVLKIHAAGFLDNPNGAVTNRGASGNYFSNVQSDTDHGWYLYPTAGGSNTSSFFNKACAMTVRCIRD